ncbi:MAG TPA: hypothetical protein VGR26_12255 [Acidimicrobiales bacterium]|nr:hypothetical protein [Acidimicrobiales bacterium]
MERQPSAMVGPRRVLTLLMAATSVIVAACGADSDEATQPRPDVTTFEEGAFDDLPLVPESDPVTAPNQEDGVDTRSYVARNTTPAEVLEFYEQQLAEFTVVSAPEQIGEGTYRGRWQLDGGRVLTVSATPGESLRSGDSPYAGEFLAQYSLTLAPEER